MKAAEDNQVKKLWQGLLWFFMALALTNSLVHVLLDNRPLSADAVSNLAPAVELRLALSSLGETGLETWREWVERTDFRPPLPFFLYQPALFLLDDQVLAIRLTELLFFIITLWLIFDVGRRLISPEAGLLAMVAFAFHPGVHQWSYMVNADPIIWASLVFLLWVLIRLDLQRRRDAVLLGLAVGACLATRLLCVMYLVAPCLWVAAFKVRTRRSLLNLLLAGACVMAVAGWWYVLQVQGVLANVEMSTGTQTDVAPGLPRSHFLWEYVLNGWLYVLAAAALCAVGCAMTRALGRDHLLLLAGWVLIPAAQLIFIWDVSGRYPFSALPAAMLLMGALLHHLTLRRPAWARALLWSGALAVALIPMACLRMGHYHWLTNHGLLALGPHQEIDRRIYDGLFRATRDVPDKAKVLVASDLLEKDYHMGMLLQRKHPRFELIDSPDTQTPYTIRAPQRIRYILRVVYDAEEGQVEDGYHKAPGPWWRDRGSQFPSRRISSAQNPDHVRFDLHRLEEAEVIEPPPQE